MNTDQSTAIERNQDAPIQEQAAQSQSKEPPALVKADGTPTPAGWHYIVNKLAQPMQAKTRRGRGNLQFEYITARQVQDRLDDVVGPGNWSTQYHVLQHDPDKNIVVVECQLTVFGVTKADVGTNNNPDIPEYVEVKDSQGQRITDQTTGEIKTMKNPAWENEPFKAAYSDALKRAAVHWSIGRFLYRD